MSVNVRPHAFHIKQKPKPHCAETVDAGDSLWKLVENQDSCPEFAILLSRLRAVAHAMAK
jgi:hypothetical protein